ncbi:MAG: hypothetical protein Q9219_002105 [cf. Caloplaca sp. 3 TL-2023]
MELRRGTVKMLNERAHGFKRILTEGSSVGAKAPHDGPRAPPLRPKPLDFPQYRLQGDLDAVHEYARDFARLFVDLERNVSPKIVEALNITPPQEIPLDRLVPNEYLPPTEWLQDPATVSQPSAADEPVPKLINGAPKPGHKDLYARAKELGFPTNEAFNSICSSGRNNKHSKDSSQPPLRLSHTHRFYQNLLLMAEFWDASQDNYITTTVPTSAPTPPEEGCPSTSTATTETKYTGRRFGAPHEMPPSYREDTILAFLELAIWPFRCSILSPRSAVNRKLLFQHTRYLPIQGVLSHICHNTTDRIKARRGVLEGPLMGLHCRNTTTFRKEGERAGEGKEEVLDLLFEVGEAILVAQKRAREGKKEEEGEDEVGQRTRKERFWVEKGRRHLGEVGGGKQDRETDEWAKKEIMNTLEDKEQPMQGVESCPFTTTTTTSTGEEPCTGVSRKRKLRAHTQAYLDVKPPESTWETKMEYKMIGKDKGKGVDNVCRLSFPSFPGFLPSTKSSHKNLTLCLQTLIDLPRLRPQPPHLPR